MDKKQLKNNEFEKAFERLVKIVKLKPSKETHIIHREATAQLIRLGMLLGDKYKKTDPLKAIFYYTIAAEDGNSKALSKIIHLYAKRGIEALRPLQALRWYKVAAQKENAVAMNALGRILQKTNPKRSFAWRYKSAVKGYTEAMVRLAMCYEKGIGTIQDDGLALAWYARAASKGNAEAKRNVKRIAKKHH